MLRFGCMWYALHHYPHLNPRKHTLPATTGTTTTSPATTSVGPKPGMARNVSVEKVAQGWVVSWLPPVNRTVAVAYYRVEYKEGNGQWQYSEPISKDSAYLIKNLNYGTIYTFRVWAYSILGVGEVSLPLEYKISGTGDGRGAKAITAGIVGSVLFFVTAIVLSVCAVKICNKRKRRKMEKAYIMVTCPVMDGVNGGHSHGGSPVPLKQRSQSRVPGLGVMLIRSILQRVGGRRFQRRSAEPRQVAGRSSSPTVQSIEEVSTDWHESGRAYPASRRRAMRNVRYNVEMEYSRPLGWISRAADGKFVVKGAYGKLVPSEEHSHMYDLTPSNQASVRGSFRSDGSGQSAHQTAPQFASHRHQTVLSRSSLQSSLPPHAYRSFSLSPQFSMSSAHVPSIYRPNDPRFSTSSPTGIPPDSLNMEQELSSIRQPTSFERSSLSQIPISSSSLRSQLQELPSLRPIHEHLHRHHSHIPPSMRATVPIGRQPHFRPINRGPLLLETVPEAIYDSAPHSPIYHIPPSRMRTESWSDGNRHLQMSPQMQYIPRGAIRAQMRPYQNVPLPRNLEILPQTTRSQYKRDAHLSQEGSEIRFASPPKQVYKKPRAAPPPPISPSQPPLPAHPPPDEPKAKGDSPNSESSSDQPMEYTRDRLLGAVEKVRSGMLLARASPYRPPDGVQTPTSLTTPVGTPVDKAMFVQPEQQLRQRKPTPVRFADDDEVFVDESQTFGRYRMPQPPSRASITSASSGRGSTGQDGSGKATFISHTRGDSFQDEHHMSLHDKTTSSSSGIASRTFSSQLHSSTSPGQSSGISASSASASGGRAPKEVESRSHLSYLYSPHSSRFQQRSIIESPQSEPIFPSYAPPLEPLDVSVDENYEFDSISPLEAELIEKLRKEQQNWRRWQHQQQQRYQQSQRMGPFSDSEIYGTLPARRRYEDAEARCAALKEEFLRFRRRQQLLRQQEEEISSSDEFESAC